MVSGNGEPVQQPGSYVRQAGRRIARGSLHQRGTAPAVPVPVFASRRDPSRIAPRSRCRSFCQSFRNALAGNRARTVSLRKHRALSGRADAYEQRMLVDSEMTRAEAGAPPVPHPQGSFRSTCVCDLTKYGTMSTRCGDISKRPTSRSSLPTVRPMSMVRPPRKGSTKLPKRPLLGSLSFRNASLATARSAPWEAGDHENQVRERRVRTTPTRRQEA